MNTYYPYGRPPKPRLYRLSRYLRWASVLATVLVIVYIVLAIFSLVVNHPTFTFYGSGSGGGSPFGSCANQTRGGSGSANACGFNVTNPGWFPFTLQAAFSIHEVNGPLLAHGSTPLVTIAPSTSENVALSLEFFALPSNNSTYVASGWINGSYASLFSLTITISLNGKFSFSPGTPVVAHACGGLSDPAFVKVPSSGPPLNHGDQCGNLQSLMRRSYALSERMGR